MKADMAEPIIEVTGALPPDDAAAIEDGLNRFNDEATGYSDRVPLAVVARDPETGDIVGGATGRSSLGLLFIDIFWLRETSRGSGLGSRILRMAEEEGRRRGCRSAVLYTISFQAPGFYQRNGWRIFGEIACDPPGTSRVFMTKDL
jgi:GNAT superfamily N-acetyltransferase